jgi:hypothetical protein
MPGGTVANGPRFTPRLDGHLGQCATTVVRLSEKGLVMNALLWLVAVVIAIVGIVQLLQGQIILGILLLVAACLIGPGGYSVFGRRDA